MDNLDSDRAIPYQSYCWCIGTTSFRTEEFNRRIEEQLRRIAAFWEEHPEDSWQEAQHDYYRYIRECGLTTGKAPRPDKDARQKTSGMKQIGLLDHQRRLTSAGRRLLSIVDAGDFSSDNSLGLAKDSFLFFGQLLKVDKTIGQASVRPFLVLSYLLDRLGELSLTEFTYLLPLCTSADRTRDIGERIVSIRQGNGSPDDVLLETLMAMENIRAVYAVWMNAATVTEELLVNIGLNRKSRNGKAYDKAYYPLYCVLERIWSDREDNRAIESLIQAVNGLSGQPAAFWRRYLFPQGMPSFAKRHTAQALFGDVPLFACETLSQFRDAFFKLLHLFKMKSTLHDYGDVNRRYFKTTDAVLFEDDKVLFDILPKAYFALAWQRGRDSLLAEAFQPTHLLGDDCPLEAIHPALAIDERAIYRVVQAEYRLLTADSKAIEELRSRLHLQRFQSLIDARFPRARLMELLGLFETRTDKKIKALVTDNADVPTIFEYILGIIWYEVSGRRGDILHFMRLSLDADLLPKSHAVGGGADIVYRYEAGNNYPAHDLLLEATLATGTGQARQETEPIVRHLGQRRLQTGCTVDYVLFVATERQINTISDFRSRRQFTFYDTKDETHYVRGLKILPLLTDDLRAILQNNLTYEQLYPILEAAYTDLSEDVSEWHERCIRAALRS